jgi:hypothetical protein
MESRCMPSTSLQDHAIILSEDMACTGESSGKSPQGQKGYQSVDKGARDCGWSEQPLPFLNESSLRSSIERRSCIRATEQFRPSFGIRLVGIASLFPPQFLDNRCKVLSGHNGSNPLGIV